MRIVAIALVLVLSAGLLPPAHAAPYGPTDECADSLTASRPCVHADTTDAPGAPNDARRVVYLWLAAHQCAPTFNASCSGRQATSPVVLGFVGVVYEETNGEPGLQRLTSSAWTGDRMILL